MSAANPPGQQIVPGKFDLLRTRLCLSRCRSSPAKYIDHVGYFRSEKNSPLSANVLNARSNIGWNYLEIRGSRCPAAEVESIVWTTDATARQSKAPQLAENAFQSFADSLRLDSIKGGDFDVLA
jgi:hypothetical protein